MITNAPHLSLVLLNMLNFLLQVFGIIAIIGLLTASVVYLTAGGNENRLGIARKIILYSIIGISIALGAMVIIKTLSGFFS